MCCEDITHHYGQIALFLLFSLLMACRGSLERDVVARVGSEKLTARELAEIAGKPLDSLAAKEQWELTQEWVEQTLVELEGKRLGLDKDPQIKSHLRDVTAALYRSRMLADLKTPAPTDSVVEAYYRKHRDEFIRTDDAYLVELYWAEQQLDLAKFCRQVQASDSIILDLWPDIASEGRWLVEHGELDKDIISELENLPLGEFTVPRNAEDGYRVFRLLDAYHAGERMKLATVRDEITQRLLIEQSKQRQEELMNQLKQKYQISVTVEDSVGK